MDCRDMLYSTQLMCCMVSIEQGVGLSVPVGLTARQTVLAERIGCIASYMHGVQAAVGILRYLRVCCTENYTSGVLWAR